MFNNRFFNMLGSIILLTVIILSACAPKPENVAERLVEAVNSQDIEGALDLFAEDAVVDTGGPVTYQGTVEIKGWLEELASDNFEIRVESVEVNGDTITERETLSMDSWSAMGLSTLQGVSEIKVQDGRVQSLVFTFTEASLNDLQAATLKATKPSYSNIPYINDGNPVHMLDLYLPSEGTHPYPVILMIHGSGDEKDDHSGMAGYFNQAGFATVLTDYGNEISQMVPDALCALAWIRANANEYGLDADRVTVFGFSVGGLVASTIGTLDNRPSALQDCDYQLPSDGDISGVVTYEGILGTPEGCLSQSWCLAGASADTGIPLMELQPIFEIMLATTPEEWKDVDTVGPEAEAFARGFPLYWLDGSEPPFLIIHGSGEDGLPRVESEAFASRLKDAGVDVELLLLPTASHQSVYPSSASFADIAGAIVDFAGRLGNK